MGLSMTEKNFWIGELKNALERRIRQVENESGNPNWREETEKEAIAVVIEKLGMTEKVRRMGEIERVRDELAHELSTLQDEVQKTLNPKGVGWRGQSPEFHASNHPSYEETVKEVRARYDVYISIVALERRKEDVERSIMFATSSADLKRFVQGFCAALGLTLDIVNTDPPQV